jgi:hypothetical protein
MSTCDLVLSGSFFSGRRLIRGIIFPDRANQLQDSFRSRQLRLGSRPDFCTYTEYLVGLFQPLRLTVIRGGSGPVCAFYRPAAPRRSAFFISRPAEAYNSRRRPVFDFRRRTS